MRLINEDDVLEIIERVTNEAVEKSQRKYLIQPRIIAEIAGLPTIEAEPVNGWISVKDRLPDDKERYLICTEGGRDEIAYYQPIGDKFSDYEPFWQGRSCRFTSVTHWQPLPKRSKEDNDG